MTAEKFESWGVVELFGHQQIAGRISEATIGGCSFVRVDVPTAITDVDGGENQWKYTRYFGQGAIYALNPTSEAVARVKACNCQEPPFAYDVNQVVIKKAVENRLKEISAPQKICPTHGGEYSGRQCPACVDEDDSDDNEF